MMSSSFITLMHEWLTFSYLSCLGLRGCWGTLRLRHLSADTQPFAPMANLD